MAEYLDRTGLIRLRDKIEAKFVSKSQLLGSDDKILSSLLPSYVDDVVEGYLINGVFWKESRENSIRIPEEPNKIYVDLKTNKTYRWSGTQYVEISSSLALGETSTTAYFGDKGKKNATDIANLQGRMTSVESLADSANKGQQAANTAVNSLDTFVKTKLLPLGTQEYQYMNVSQYPDKSYKVDLNTDMIIKSFTESGQSSKLVAESAIKSLYNNLNDKITALINETLDIYTGTLNEKTGVASVIIYDFDAFKTRLPLSRLILTDSANVKRFFNFTNDKNGTARFNYTFYDAAGTLITQTLIIDTNFPETTAANNYRANVFTQSLTAMSAQEIDEIFDGRV